MGERISLRTYLGIAVLVPVLTLLAMFPLASTQFFMHISRRAMWHATEYRFVMGRQDCDVVIFGDSTGMVDVDPHLLEARTGWKTCNLALPYMVTSVMGTEVLDRYLAQNKPPRFLVLHLSPGHLHRPYLDEDNGVVDGWLELDAHESHGKAAWFFLSHAKKSFYFAAEVLRQFLTTNRATHPDFTQQTYSKDIAALRADDGWFPQNGTYWPAVCDPVIGTEQYDRSYLDRMVARYSRPGTQVVVWAGPARTCDARLQSYRKGLASLHLPDLRVYPPNMFSDAYHLNREGAERNTESLIKALLADNSQQQSSATK